MQPDIALLSVLFQENNFTNLYFLVSLVSLAFHIWVFETSLVSLAFHHHDHVILVSLTSLVSLVSLTFSYDRFISTSNSKQK